MPTIPANLSLSERILMVEELWDSIAADPAATIVDADEIAYVHDRLEAIERDGENLVSWDEVKASVRNRAG